MNIIDKLKCDIDEINKEFRNSYLNKIQQISQNDFLFSFSRNQDKSLFISLNFKSPFISTLGKRLLLNNPSAFSNRLRQKISNALFINAEIINNDNIVCLNFVKTTDTYDKIQYKLIIELFKSNSNIILLNNNVIVDCFKLKSLDTKRPILINMNYSYPKKIEEIKEYKEDNFIFDYTNSIEKNFINEKYNNILLSLKRKIKSLNKKLEKLNKDKIKLQENLHYKDYADYLLINLENIKKGDKFFVFEGNNINLKETFTPTQNLEYFYKQYKKAKTGIELNKKYILECEDEISYLESIINQFDLCNENDLEELVDELEKRSILKSKNNPKKNTTIKKTYKPYYILFNKTKIGFGKNSMQNNELTFKIAKPNNWFLHINKNHGSHVVIFSDKPTNDEKEFASELAIYLSKLEDGDVCYTLIKDVKKSPIIGKVNLLKYETFHINKFKYDIKKYYEESKRF